MKTTLQNPLSPTASTMNVSHAQQRRLYRLMLGLLLIAALWAALAGHALAEGARAWT